MLNSMTLDGLACVGKTTVSRILANNMGWKTFSTGLLYRVFAFECLEEKVDVSKQEEVLAYLFQTRPRIRLVDDKNSPGGTVIVVTRGENGAEKVFQQSEECLQTDPIAQAASIVSGVPEVRRLLFDIQRNIGLEENIILDGRDCGTVVLPEARMKVFLKADPLVRARRKLGTSASEHQVRTLAESLSTRDTREMTRAISPLVPAKDAIIVDTTHMDIMEVVQLLEKEWEQKRGTRFSGREER